MAGMASGRRSAVYLQHTAVSAVRATTGAAGLIRASYYGQTDFFTVPDDPDGVRRAARRKYLLANFIYLALLIGSVVRASLLTSSPVPCKRAAPAADSRVAGFICRMRLATARLCVPRNACYLSPLLDVGRNCNVKPLSASPPGA